MTGASLLLSSESQAIARGRINLKASSFPLLDHPIEREFRKAAFGLWIAAADVAVDAGKPNLFYVLLLWRSRLVEGVWHVVLGFHPTVQTEHSSSFVNGHR